MTHLLVTDFFYPNEEGKQQLLAMGYESLSLNEARSQNRLNDVNYLLCGPLFLEKHIDELPHLKWVQMASAGYDRVPFTHPHLQGIPFANSKGIFSIPIAEWVLLKLLEIYKKTSHFIHLQKTRSWQQDFELDELYGKHAAIVGYGSIGQEISRRFHAFGVSVDVFNRSPMVHPHINSYYPLADLSNRISSYDIVIVTLALNTETHHLFDQTLLSCLSPKAIFINVARGSIVDEPALIESLKRKQFRGAILDVFEHEPLPQTSPLYELDNVILSPHNSWGSIHNEDRVFHLFMENLRRFEQDLPLLNPIQISSK